MSARKESNGRKASPQNLQAFTVMKSGSHALKPAGMPILSDPSMKTLWVDSMQAHSRANPSLVHITFTAVHPNHQNMIEVARIQMTREHAQNMVNALTQLLNNTPTTDPDV
ncbi:MAG: hypothetical protein HC898_04185 [Phycisphaerales bacterium]|nr:hypothetical protein [Phycisphaerales bacterium]